MVKKRSIAVIPARGGSRRIPNKNIKDFAGKPIISYSIEAAINSDVFDRVIVSTDSERIAEVACRAGAEVPFVRPPELAHDSVSIVDVVRHAISWLKEHGDDVDYICCIHAAAPFLRSDFLAEGLRLIRQERIDTVIYVTKFPSPILRAFKIAGDGRARLIWPEHELSNSDELDDAYYDAGQCWWADAERLLASKGSAVSKGALPVILPEYLARDIDTPEDWEMAEIMYDVCKKKGLL